MLTITTAMRNSKQVNSRKKATSLIILGIDPGLADTGFGVIKKQGSALTMIDYGCIKTKTKTPDQDRLMIISQKLNALIKKYQPEIMAVEKIFFAKNAKTALAVGQARGVIILAAGKNKLKVAEFTPLQIKMALTNYGQASKDQVQQMVKIILKLKVTLTSDDASDALAAAICCAHTLTKTPTK